MGVRPGGRPAASSRVESCCGEIQIQPTGVDGPCVHVWRNSGTGRPRTTLGERRYRACEVPVRDVSGDGSSEARRRVVSAGAGDTRLPGLRFPG